LISRRIVVVVPVMSPEQTPALPTGTRQPAMSRQVIVKTS
jgi:hypothetical protein